MADLAEPEVRRVGGGRDDLPYRVELWDDSGAVTARLLAACQSRTLGYTSYYAALREYFGEHVTLRDGETLLASTPAQRR